MDLRTGKLYNSVEDARADGVPESDIAHVEAEIDGRDPTVSFDEPARRKAALAASKTYWPAK